MHRFAVRRIFNGIEPFLNRVYGIVNGRLGLFQFRNLRFERLHLLGQISNYFGRQHSGGHIGKQIIIGRFLLCNLL